MVYFIKMEMNNHFFMFDVIITWYKMAIWAQGSSNPCHDDVHEPLLHVRVALFEHIVQVIFLAPNYISEFNHEILPDPQGIYMGHKKSNTDQSYNDRNVVVNN